MDVTTLPRTVLRAEYAVIRRPIQLAQDRILSLFPEGGQSRLGAERVIGQVDTFAGRLLRDAELTGRGEDLQAHAAATAKAQTLKAKAAEQREQADKKLATTTHKAATARTTAVKDHAEEAQAADRRAATEKAAAVNQANARATAAKKTAAAQASARVTAAENKQQAAHTSTRKQADAVTAAPKAHLAEARETSREAAEQRADADRLASLAENEKLERKN